MGFWVQALLGGGASVVLEGQKVVPTRTQDAGFRFQFSHIGPAIDNSCCRAAKPANAQDLQQNFSNKFRKFLWQQQQIAMSAYFEHHRGSNRAFSSVQLPSTDPSGQRSRGADIRLGNTWLGEHAR